MLCNKHFYQNNQKKKPLNAIKIYNPSKSLSSEYTKVTRRYKITISIDNIIEKLANIYELQTELIKCIIKFLVSIYSHNKHLLLDGLKLLKNEKNMPIFLFLIDKIQKDQLYEKCGVAYKGEDEIQI